MAIKKRVGNKNSPHDARVSESRCLLSCHWRLLGSRQSRPFGVRGVRPKGSGVRFPGGSGVATAEGGTRFSSRSRPKRPET